VTLFTLPLDAVIAERLFRDEHGTRGGPFLIGPEDRAREGRR
jgi:hypothetical protein